MARCGECLRNEYQCECGTRLAALISSRADDRVASSLFFTDEHGHRYLHGEVAAAIALGVLAVVGTLLMVFGHS